MLMLHAEGREISEFLDDSVQRHTCVYNKLKDGRAPLCHGYITSLKLY